MQFLSEQHSPWQIKPIVEISEEFIQVVKQYAAGLPGHYAAQLLWQRGVRDPNHLAGFLNPDLYHPTSPLEFGQEMDWAIARLQKAWQASERIAIWGDFDADGITATAVLWEGLGQFFAQHEQLTYHIPNRLRESHGLAIAGINTLAESACHLIITCDTGSTNLKEIEQAHGLGIDIIITDHHALPAERPPVTAIINPHYLPSDHPLAKLSGVAVAYKLVEAMYQVLPDVPRQPLENLLDLVAIGLVADLVELTGDCRYLAQRGIQRLQQNQMQDQPSRPGVARLLELCKKSGDRPTDISFGIGPRINAISRIQGDARFGVELLTSQDIERCRQLAEETELANARRKSLQKEIVQQVKTGLARLDLSTTSVIVLADPQWPVGVLGLVAGQIAQEYNRPTILLSTEGDREWGIGNEERGVENGQETDKMTTIARGSARSVNQIDLYQLVKNQEHLLQSFGGHPFAAGLSLPVDNIPLFTEALNRQLREQQFATEGVSGRLVQADLVVTVVELGKDLFRELKLLEPYGIGNATPQLLIQNCWFTSVWNRNMQDWRGHKVRYIKTEFEIWDDSTTVGFPGVWWEHYKDEIPQGRCDAIAELDFNTYTKRYEIRLIAVRTHNQDASISASASVAWLLDWRNSDSDKESVLADAVIQITQCPSSWDELQAWFRRAIHENKKLAIAYPPPNSDSPADIWQRLVGIAKYLSRTGQSATRTHLLKKLGIGDRTLQLGFSSLKLLQFEITSSHQGFQMSWQSSTQSCLTDTEISKAIQQFLAAVREEQFHQQYFYNVSLNTMRLVAEHLE
jgi:single-stranded-DNA-specific exonuclease